MQRAVRSSLLRASRLLLLSGLVLWSVLPIVWLVTTSLKSRTDIFTAPPRLIFRPDMGAYMRLLGSGSGSVWPFAVNSLVVAVGATLLTIGIGVLAAYGFSRYRFKWSGPLLIGIVASRLLPPVTGVVPLFLLMSRWGLLDTRVALVFVNGAMQLAFAVMLLKSFFDAIPREIEEAALVDGCSALGAMWRIVARLAVPGLAATSIFVFVETWNEFTFAFIFSSVSAKTMPVLLAETLGEMEIFWQDMSALATLIVLPALVFGYWMQKHMVSGLTTGAIK